MNRVKPKPNATGGNGFRPYGVGVGYGEKSSENGRTGPLPYHDLDAPVGINFVGR